MTQDLYDLEDVYVGDTGPVLQPSLTDIDLYTVFPLSGYSAYVRMWYVGATTTHVVWPVTVDPNNSLLLYEPRGVEYPTVGEVHIQFTVVLIDWSTTAIGQAFIETSSRVLRRRVLARDA